MSIVCRLLCHSPRGVLAFDQIDSSTQNSISDRVVGHKSYQYTPSMPLCVSGMIGGGVVDCDPVVKRDYPAEMLGDELGETFRLRPLPDRVKPVMNGVNLLQDLLLDCWLRP
jgi:hypothetical protein